MTDIVPCTECGEDRAECGHPQECEDCKCPIFVDTSDCAEWPETGVIRCWDCQHKLIEMLTRSHMVEGVSSAPFVAPFTNPRSGMGIPKR